MKKFYLECERSGRMSYREALFETPTKLEVVDYDYLPDTDPQRFIIRGTVEAESIEEAVKLVKNALQSYDIYSKPTISKV